MYSDLIGVPFKYGGRGPDFYDCYGLVKELHRRRGIELPDFISPDTVETVAPVIAIGMQGWRLAKAVEGNCIAIQIRGYVSHIGYLISPDRMIHTWEKTGGVTIEPIDLWKRRIYGFYEYVG